MALYLKLIVVAIVLVVFVMGVYGLKLLYDKGSTYNVDADPEKYKKMKEEGIYSAYKEENKEKEE